MAVQTDSGVVLPAMQYFTKTVHHDTYDKISPTRSELSAQGKTVVVTGGGTGIGKSIAKSFAEAGARSVAILGRREDRLKSTVAEIDAIGSSKSLYRVVDLMDGSAVASAFESIVAESGKIDILISNAAVLPQLGPITGYDAKEFMRSFEANVLSSFNAVQALLPCRASQATIINVSTSLAHMKPIPGTSGYAVSKAAQLKMMDYFAAENADVHVVNLQPGTVETEMSSQVGVKAPDKVALPGHFAVWLASPEASFLKSKFVWANWDIDELLAIKDEVQKSNLFTWRLDGNPM